MNHDQIEGLAAILREVPKLTEIEVRHEGTTLRLRRAGRPSLLSPARATTGHTAPLILTAPKTMVLTAQHVGIFLALKDKLPQVGQLVKVDQVLGRLDTMRLLSDCQATVSGRLHAIFVEDGQPVEYGQPLFEILPEAS